jgi:hypothetical protein
MSGNLFRSAFFAIAVAACALAPRPASAQTAYGITGTGQLVRFSATAPNVFLSSVAVTGLQAGETLLGIDFRPLTGELWGLGSTSRVYIINTTTGAATQVGSAGAFTLNGTSFGFDFNPSVDRIRVVSDADQNLRLNPVTGGLAATDTALNYAIGDAHQGANPNVVGSAYSNNIAGSTTTLYGIDTTLDILVSSSNPNGGILNTVGPLGVNATAVLGFDILTVRSVNSGYAVLQVAGVSGLYSINLTTGAAALIGNFPGGTTVTGLAVLPDPPRLVNISTRMQVLTGERRDDRGLRDRRFVEQGCRRRRHGSVAGGLRHRDPLGNPTFTVVRSSDQVVVATNDNWQSASNAAALQAAGFAPPDPLEAGILVNLPPGAYTAVVQGVSGTTGVAVAAVYEVSGKEIPLVNISTRGRVLTGNDVMIGGFVIQGSRSQDVAIVATGPSLAAYGIANPLANPTLTLIRSSDQAVLATNDDWQSAANAAQIQSAGFAPPNALESAILMTLPPGAYTAIVQGVGGGTGVAVVGVYKVN